MTRATGLTILLRVVGTSSLGAIPFAMMPLAWLGRIHAAIGLGPLPVGPAVGYLARSTSLFYAAFGGLLWMLSLDLVGYRPLLVYLGWAMIGFGVFLGVVDTLEGLPLWWRLWEGPMDCLFGVLILCLLPRRPTTDIH